MKKCLIISYYYPPFPSVASLRPQWMHELLPLYGWDSGVLTHCFDNRLYKDSADQQIWRALDVSPASEPWAHKVAWFMHRLGGRAKKAAGGAISPQSFWKIFAKKKFQQIVSAYQPNVLLATYPPIDTLELGLWAHRQYGIPLVADFRDGLLFESMEPFARFPKWEGRCNRVEQQIARQAAGIITVTDPITGYFAERYRLDKVATISNGYFPRSATKPVLPASNNWYEPGRVNIVYTGRIGFSDRSVEEVFAEFVNQVGRFEKKDLLRIHFLGWLRDEENRQLHDLQECGIVRCHGPVSHVEALAAQQAADWLLLLVSRKRQSVATGKLFEYLQARRPILALGGESAARRIIGETGTGLSLDPGILNELPAFLLEMVEDSAAAQNRHYHPIDEAIERYDVRKLTGRLADVLEQAAINQTEN